MKNQIKMTDSPITLTPSRAVPLSFLLSLALLVASPVRAEEISSTSAPSTPNMLLINPGDLLNGIISIEYERAMATWFGIAVGVSVHSFRGVFSPVAQSSYIALVPELGFRFHFIRDAPGGLWLGPYIGAGYIASRSSGLTGRSFGWGLGAAVGYNFIIGKHFVFQLGVGSGFNDYGDGILFAPRLRLGLGGVF